ncbi:G-type lectin S-receptor-like serine/threonine-protein kinase At1g11300 [Vicia villosa]|uniref:G-type lectin S-receptor-like serine/threonine-protein kinase At1g11300 n=1 Tax=Vicia villosa TaxID=3911 RepID=UPI00273C6808|nr:G-type lectin S-receptor-like serine/threonine-protein kinase At1g11300 [Vicia villosa]
MSLSKFKNLISVFNFIILLLCCSSLHLVLVVATSNTISSSSSSSSSQQLMKDNETLSSNNGNFTLGFFTPQNSTNRYLGIWCKTQDFVVWVANRNQPLVNDSSGVLTISNDDGNLVVLNGQKHAIWSSSLTNVTSKTNSSFTLSDYGSLVLSETTTGVKLWESFQQPSNALLQTMKFTSNMTLTSWKTLSDPSNGSFSIGIKLLNIPEVFIWNGTRPYWRSGPWNNQIFIGIQDMATLFIFNGFKFEKDSSKSGTVVLSFEAEDYGLLIYALNPQGELHENSWSDEEEKWNDTWTTHRSDCDVYGFCGPFGICNSEGSPICSCLEGFEARNLQEWNQKNWTNGCVRKKLLQCEEAKNQSSSSSRGNETDSFLHLRTVKVPDFAELSSNEQDECKNQCLMNCSCTAYTYVASIGCMSWNGNLIDIQQFQSGGTDLYIRVPYVELQVSDKGHKRTIIIAVSVSIGVIIIVAYFIWIKALKPERKKKHHRIFHFHKIEKPEEHSSENVIGELSQAKLQELLLFNFEKLATATNNFHSSNKLGQGGFGPVYKGILQDDGKEIAVKRLSRSSGQGLEEFMNEVVVISKLQHRNLVRLLGCCIERNEKMLMYEFMTNGSLDAYVFDPSRNKLLDWEKRFSIIEGIARGLLYLHRDSRLKIIHRDLKASNILLDEEMNPKISDFGMARIFGVSEDHANTQRIVGTYGYMAPEYAMQGVFSDKSDVFSFGVLLIEIVCGRRNSSFYEHENSLTLLGFAWTQWREGNIICLIEPEMYDDNHHKDILRCIHIGLLCVQESAVDRPTMGTVIYMLNSEIMELPPARQPAFLLMQNMMNTVCSEERNEVYSNNDVTITDLHGR